MDYSLFCEHVKKQQEMEAIDNSQFKLDEKFQKMDRQIQGLISKNQLQAELKNKLSTDKFIELKTLVDTLKSTNEKENKFISVSVLGEGQMLCAWQLLFSRTGQSHGKLYGFVKDLNFSKGVLVDLCSVRVFRARAVSGHRVDGGITLLQNAISQQE